MIKFCFFLVFVLCCCYANAATVCSRNDKVVIGLGADKVPTSAVYDNDTFEWRVSYNDFGTISGIASCVPFNSDNTQCSQYGLGQYFGCPFTQSGKDPNINYQGRKDGKYCWCKITHPFESKWVFQHIYTADCATTCASHCVNTNGMLSTQNFRKWILLTVGMDE